MTTGPALATVSAVLSVAEGPRGQDHAVKLAVHDQNAAGVKNQIAVTTLDRELAQALSNNVHGIGTWLDRKMSKKDRMAAGRQLFNAAFHGDVAVLWAHLQALADDGHKLRVRLDVQPILLRGLPWELLRSGNEWIFLRKNTFSWRGPAPQPLTQDDVGPMRVLVVICNPLDWRVLADEELAGISRALASQLGRVHLEILDGPSRDRLTYAIDRLQPHILHFIGHGMPRLGFEGPELIFNWVPQQTVIADAHPLPWGLSSSDIKQLAAWEPRLVVINACRTADDPLDPVGGFADAFLDAGTRAVVSMQADIQSPAAVLFSGALYKGLGDLTPLDEVVAAARRRLVMESGDTGEWALPVLAARTDPADVLRISFAPTKSSISGMCGRQEYSSLQNFLDRSTERWNAWRALDPQPEQLTARSVLAIGGRQIDMHRSGKTWFARWCLFICFLLGHRVTYVDLARPLRDPDRPVKTKNWLDVIRVIRDACICDQQADPLPAEAFDQFNVTLNAFVASQARSDLSVVVPSPTLDDWRPFDDDRRNAHELTYRICSEFLDALREASHGRPHVLALDNIDSVLSEAFDSSIYPWLIRPVAQEGESSVRLVLIASDDWLGAHLPPADAGLWTRLKLEGFDSTHFMRLARDYCQRRGLDFDVLLGYLRALEGLYANKAVPVEVFDLALSVVPGVFRTEQP